MKDVVKIKCIIVDDEPDAAEGHFLLLQDENDISVEAICHGGIAAIEAIERIKPDLLLIDITMPDLSGFEVIRTLSEKPPVVVFITAHDKYALKAFEVHALDYILKPYRIDRFKATIERARELIRNQKNNRVELQEFLKEELNHASEGKFTSSRHEEKLLIRADGRVHMVKLSEISHIEAYDYYVKYHWEDRVVLSRDSLKHVEELLDERFIRVHRSYILNLDFVKLAAPLPNREYLVTLSNGAELRVSRSYGAIFHDALSAKAKKER